MDDVGRVIAERYRLDARVGSGAMGVVWRAGDERLGRTVALKQVSLRGTGPDPDAEAREQTHRRVMREGRMIARLHHPNAIAVYDVVDHEDEPWLVMEYLSSASLADTLSDGGPLTPDRVARLGAHVAAALAAAHDAGIVHRDVKPGNVLLGDEGITKVTDFGIARAVDEATLTSSGMMAGTPAYLAPEVARGSAADFRSDVFSLGSTLYAAIEGSPPFGTGDNPLALLHRVASGEHAAPRRAGSLAPLLAGMLDGEPDRRPPMNRVREELTRLASAEAVTGTGPMAPLMAPLMSTGMPTGMSTGTPTGMPNRAPVVTPRPAPPPGPPRAAVGPRPTTPTGPASGPPTSPSTSPSTNPPTSPPTSPATTSPVATGDAAPERPRRRGVLLIAAGIAVVTLAAVVTVLLVAGLPAGVSSVVGSDTPSATTGGSGSSDSSGSGSGSSGTGSSGDGSSAGSGTPVALSGDPDQRAQQQAVVDYYALLPDRLDEGWQRLTPTYQRTTADGFAGYRGFWSAIGTVTVAGVSSAGGDTVDTTVSYRYRDGRTVAERTLFRMVLQDGAWKIDGSTVQSSR